MRRFFVKNYFFIAWIRRFEIEKLQWKLWFAYHNEKRTLNSECFSFFCCVLLFFRICLASVYERVFVCCGYFTTTNTITPFFFFFFLRNVQFDMDVLVLLSFCFDNGFNINASTAIQTQHIHVNERESKLEEKNT